MARAFSALAGVATVALVPGVTVAALVLGVASGWLFGALWQRDRAGWAPLGAHAAWILFTGSILHGGLFDTDWVVGNLSTGTSAAGAPAWLASAAMLAVAAAIDRRRDTRGDTRGDARRPPISPDEAPVAPSEER